MKALQIPARTSVPVYSLCKLVVAALLILMAAGSFFRLRHLSFIRTTVYNESDPTVFEAAVLPGFIQQDPDAPKLLAFRRHIASLVTDTDDDISKMVAIQHWVRGQENDEQFYGKPGQTPRPMVDGTEEPEKYLEQQRQGVPSACRRFSYILTGALLSAGINARVVSVAESLDPSSLLPHNLVEVWVPNLHKWIMLDPTIDAFVLVNGTPASLLEVYAAARPGSPMRISFDQHGSHYRIPPLDKYRRYFRHLFVARTNAIFDGYHYGLFGAKKIGFVHYAGQGIEPYPEQKKNLLLAGLAVSAGTAALLCIQCAVGLLVYLVKILAAASEARKQPPLVGSEAFTLHQEGAVSPGISRSKHTGSTSLPRLLSSRSATVPEVLRLSADRRRLADRGVA